MRIDALRRLRTAWRDVVVSSAAAGASWLVAVDLLGNSQPVFAPIAAIIGLSPGIDSRRLQTAGMFGGVVIGILVGGAAHGLDLTGAIATFTVTLTAMTLASAFGLAAVLVIQAGASALVVVGTDLTGTAATRLEDAVVGATIALVCSQILFPADCFAVLRKEGRGLLECADRLLRQNCPERIDLRNVVNAADAVHGAFELARQERQWTVFGRIRGARIDDALATLQRPAVALIAGMLDLIMLDEDTARDRVASDAAALREAIGRI